MREDLGPPPARPPRKKRQLEKMPDVWLRLWLDSDQLTPSDRRRVEEQIEERKAARKETIVGFTGTRAGLSRFQRRQIRQWLIELEPTEAHHGDCVGGDEQFHRICRGLNIPIVIHPPENGALRAFCKGALRVEKAKDYLPRNKDIVQASTVLLGAPKEASEPAPGRGQGTWSTIRYARNRATPQRVVMPDGEILNGERNSER